MLKKFLALTLAIFSCLLLVGCTQLRAPYNVYFKNATAVNSKNYVLGVIYLADKQMQNFYTDIWVKSDEGDLDFSFGKEGSQKTNVYIDEPYKWYSLSALYSAGSSQPKVFERFKKKLSTNYIFNFKKKTNLTFLCVRGDLDNQTNNLKNIHNSSNEFKLAVKNV